MSENQYPGIDARVVSIVRSRARKLIGQYGIQAHDVPDLEQQWIARVVGHPDYQRQQHPDFCRMMAQITHDMAVEEIRRRTARKRNSGRVLASLDEYLGPESDSVTRGDLVSEEDYLGFVSGDFRSAAQVADARMDADAFLRQLPPDLRDLALHLQAHQVSDIPSMTGISRATMFRQLQRLRDAARRFFDL